ncbi:hypothetical protein TTHERM_00469370 (macronuclear) [Tetrahymena thermophila SB210]|uniref:Uncharacterized protein n=1 Tax=Tetrahymena thermophila (strain SB210) TaxID=312017 RepID=I7MAM6_TETTS|nr:hypothetical protein TTHERM_00469370 [Tetrahymena thermophila SB210]EAS04888.1 hypothetical protein TTHERM_00469370 [Tetrahymena thermophila SB210]|eukprot:XP_001025133.1 hypothetical protein TTHERM_00469370 [Tetrahymena thermophila SB210]
MNQNSRDKYLSFMKSSAEDQYQKEQQQLKIKQQQKQKIINHRNVVIFGTDDQKKQVEKNLKNQIQLQCEIKRQIESKDKEEQRKNTGIDSITNMQRENYIDNQYRNQMLKQIQRENKILAQEKQIKQQNEKRENQMYNQDRFLDYSKRNQYFF